MGRKSRQTAIISDASSSASVVITKSQNPRLVLELSPCLGTLLGVKAMGRWPVRHRLSQLSSLNLLPFLLGSPALSPLFDAIVYRGFLAEHEVSDSKTRHRTVKNSRATMFGDGLSRRTRSLDMRKVSKSQPSKAAAFVLPASTANNPVFFY